VLENLKVFCSWYLDSRFKSRGYGDSHGFFYSGGFKMNEIWKDILGYEGDYQVSNKGRVKSFVKYPEGRILKPCNRGNGYLYINLYKNGTKKKHSIHRLVATAFIKNPENKATVNHLDSNTTNNNLENLEWATHAENTKHGFEFGNFDNRGERQGNSKLTEKEVLEIRELYSKGNISQKEIAEIYGVSQQNIGYIINRKKWNHV